MQSSFSCGKADGDNIEEDLLNPNENNMNFIHMDCSQVGLGPSVAPNQAEIRR